MAGLKRLPTKAIGAAKPFKSPRCRNQVQAIRAAAVGTTAHQQDHEQSENWRHDDSLTSPSPTLTPAPARSPGGRWPRAPAGVGAVERVERGLGHGGPPSVRLAPREVYQRRRALGDCDLALTALPERTRRDSGRAQGRTRAACGRSRRARKRMAEVEVEARLLGG